MYSRTSLDIKKIIFLLHTLSAYNRLLFRYKIYSSDPRESLGLIQHPACRKNCHTKLPAPTTWRKLHWNKSVTTKVCLEDVYMSPEVNLNRFEISLRGKISVRCQVTSLLAFTWVQAKWNSLRCKFDRSEISNCSELSM